MDVSEAKRLRGVEDQNASLKRLLADAMLDNAALKDLLEKNGSAHREAANGRASGGEPWDERAAGVQDAQDYLDAISGTLTRFFLGQRGASR